MKAVLTEKLIALNVYIRKEERFKINNVSFYFRKPEKEEPKTSRKKEIIKI